MPEDLIPFQANPWIFVLVSLLLAASGSVGLYVILFYGLRSVFRKFERDIALVTLNVSAYPALTVFVLAVLRFTFHRLPDLDVVDGSERLLTAGLIMAISYWLIQLFTQVFIYYLKEYTQQTEVMWDDVLLPLLDAVVPVIVFILTGVFVLRSFGVDLTGIWVALGGATFVIGFATQDILANFFSGVVLLIDTPFQFGDVLELEDGSVAMLRKIGVRVTQLYIPAKHCNIYIPNSNLQSQNIINLSRPTSYYHYSKIIKVPLEYDLHIVRQMINEVILAHSDTLGEIDQKLALFNRYYQRDEFSTQQKIGRSRLLAEQDVDALLEEVSPALESLAVTLQFAEKGGLTQDEIKNVQQEYGYVLSLLGLEVVTETQKSSRAQHKRLLVTLDETRTREGLIELIRTWYRSSIRDPNLLDTDEFMIPDAWERKINLLKRRTQKLYQKISSPEREETRLDDYILELNKWLQECFKEPRKMWQGPQVLMHEIEYEEGEAYIQFTLNFYVDDIRLEDGKRGDRVSSQIYQEVVQYLKNAAPGTSAISPVHATNATP